MRVNLEYVTCPVCTEHNKVNGMPSDGCHLVAVTPIPDKDDRKESYALQFRGECGHSWEIHYRQSKGATERHVVAVLCAHMKCGKPVVHIDCFDDHDGNAGNYFLDTYCSLECFVCDLKHASEDIGEQCIKDVLARIKA